MVNGMHATMNIEAKQTALQQEAADNLRLKKANEAVEYYRQQEAEALRQLASVRASLKNACEKHEALFIECEKRAGERRKAGLIEVSSCY